MRRFKIVVLLIVTVAILCACEDKSNNTSVPISEGTSATPTETAAPTITPRQTPTPIVFENPALQELAAKDPHSWYREGVELAMESEDKYTAWVGMFDNREFYGDYCDYTRKMAEILEMIPEDWPRLTVEDAKRILREMKDEEFFTYSHWYAPDWIKTRFDEIAFAPDYYGDSGLTYIRYYVDDTKTDFIEITGIQVVLRDKSSWEPKEVLYDAYANLEVK